jgi:hypothetical protein
VDLKVQSKRRGKNCPIWMYIKLFGVKNGKIETIFEFQVALNRNKIKNSDGKICLNMNSKPDKEYKKYDNIVFLSEIITYSMIGKSLEDCKSNFM